MIKDDAPWLKDKPDKHFPSLTTDHEADIAIIGGGLTGTLSAYLLEKLGKRVVLIEKDHLASGATGYTTAFLMYMVDTSIQELVRLFGKKTAKAVWDSSKAAIDLIEEISLKEKIDCEFARCPGYIYTTDDNQMADLEAQSQTAKALGYPNELTHEQILPFPTKTVGIFPNHGKFHPVKFVVGLGKVLAQKGVAIFEGTEATKVNEKDGIYKIETPKGTVHARDVIVATYSPFNNPLSMIAKKGPYTTYVLEASIDKGFLPEALYQDLANPYHYFRIDSQGDKDRLIFGGEDHREELKLKEQSFAHLEKAMLAIFRDAHPTIEREWDGQILEPIDGLALIGEVAPHQYAATGFSGTGMTYAGVAAMIFRDLIDGKKNPWSKMYDPKRIPTLKQLAAKGKDYLEELYNGAIKKIIE